MKIICVEHSCPTSRDATAQSEEPVIFIKPDTALLTNDKKHFYIPDFTNNIHCKAQIVVRITKMGKNIAERFAHRYYNELTIGLDLMAKDLLDNLVKQGLPWEAAKGFDNSAVVGQFISVENVDVNNLNFSLLHNGKEVYRVNTSKLSYSIDSIIAHVSKYFTLKTGDLIFIGSSVDTNPLAIGDELIGFVEDSKLMEVKIC